MTDLTKLTATELSGLYRSGTVSPVTVVQQFLEKIAQFNPILNAFCFTDPDTTIKQAKASEQRWRQKQPLSALDGVPVAIKDSIHTQGWPTRYASHAVDAFKTWNTDAPIVTQLRQAGTVFVGKTTMSEFGSKITTDSLLYGITRNPWNIKFTSGGSSGGSAVAVSSSMVPIAIGTDYSGSVRIPAAFCGVVGLKPTYNEISYNNNSLFECSCIGSLAKTVQDITLMLGVKFEPMNLSNIKIAYCPDFGFATSVNYEIAQTVKNVADFLCQMGAQVTEVKMLCNDPKQIVSNMFRIDANNRWNKFTTAQKKIVGDTYRNQFAVMDKSNLVNLIKQTKLLQLQVQQHLQQFMSSYDIILSPSTAVTADRFLADDIASDQTNGSNVMQYIPFGYLFNLTHQPAVSVPVGVNYIGMPIGLQLAGAVGADALVLQLAQIVESAFPMPQCPLIF